MAQQIGWFVLGLVLLTLGTDSLVRGASGLVLRAGAGSFGLGVVLVATGAAIPMLAVFVVAVGYTELELASGLVSGGSLVQLALVPGAAALMAPLKTTMHVTRTLLLALPFAAALLLGLGWDGRLTRLDGALLLAGFIVVVVLVALQARRESAATRALLTDLAETRTELQPNLIRLALGTALLVAAAKFIVESSAAFATAGAITPHVLGAIVAAPGTALPVLIAALLAARFGRGELVPASAAGAALCSLLLLAGAGALARPLPIASGTAYVELPLLIVIAAGLLFLARSGRAIARREAIALFAAWLFVLGGQLVMALRPA